MTENTYLKNPQLPGGSFFWQAGPCGVLLFHGFTATTAEVRLIAERLHAQGYTLSAPLLPGHGTSPKDANRYSWADWVSTAESAYQEISSRCKKVYVGGESAGALLALYLASQKPEIEGILAYAPALDLSLTWVDKIKLYLFAPLVDSVPKGLMDDGTPWQGYYENPLKGTIQLLRLQVKIWPLLSKIQQPILIVQGRLDQRVPAKIPGMLRDRVRSTVKEIHWMDDSGHVVMVDHEHEKVAEITLDFLARTNHEEELCSHNS